jgi:hypothetical protein
MSRKIRDATATAVDDRTILITGGVECAAPRPAAPDGQDRIFLSNAAIAYDVATDRYHELRALPLAVADHGLACVGHRIYVVGGEDSIHRTRTDLVQCGALRLSGRPVR